MTYTLSTRIRLHLSNLFMHSSSCSSGSEAATMISRKERLGLVLTMKTSPDSLPIKSVSSIECSIQKINNRNNWLWKLLWNLQRSWITRVPPLLSWTVFSTSHLSNSANNSRLYKNSLQLSIPAYVQRLLPFFFFLSQPKPLFIFPLATS